MKKFSLQFLFSSITRSSRHVAMRFILLVMMLSGFAYSGFAKAPAPPPPVAAITGADVACVGSNDTLSDATAGGIWSSGNISVGTIGTSGVVTGIADGTTVITYTVGAITATDTIIVTSVPVVYATLGGGTFCFGGAGSDIATGGSDGGVLYTLLLNGSTSIATMFGTGGALDFGSQTTGGNYTVVADYGSSCATVMINTVTVTVNPLPTPYVLVGGGSYCSGAACPDITLNGSETGVNYQLYYDGVALSVPTGGTGVAIDFGTYCSAGTYTVHATNTMTGCTDTMANSVVISFSGHISPILGETTVCTGLTSYLTDTTTGGIWSSSNISVGTIGSATGIVGGVSAGTTTISYIVGSCYATAVVTVPAGAGPSPITGIHDLCLLSDEVIHETSVGYWSSSLVTLVDLGGGSALITGVNVGVAAVTFTLHSGCILIDTLFVNPLPVIATRDETICQGSTIDYSADIAGGNWSSNDLLVASIGAGTGLITGNNGGTAIITYQLPTGCIDTSLITVLPLPAPIMGSTGVCIGSTDTLTDATTGGTWSSSNTIVATITGSGVVDGLLSGTSIITYLLNTGCLITTTVLVNPPPAAISGPDTACAGTTVTVTDAVGGGVWLSSDTTVAQINAVTGLITADSPGVTTITYQSGAGCDATMSFTVNPVPWINGPNAICAESISGGGSQQDNAHVSVGTLSGGMWSSSDTALAVVDGSGFITGGLGMSGTLTITFTLPTSCFATYQVTINPSPAPISGATTFCVGTTDSLYDVDGGGTWSTNNLAVDTVVNLSAGKIFGVAAGSALLSYVLPTGCYQFTYVNVTPEPGPIGGPSVVCEGQSITLTDSVHGGTWISSDTTEAVVNAVTGVLFARGTGGAVVVTYELGSCSIGETITIQPLLPIMGPDTLCLGTTVTLTNGTVPGDSIWNASPGSVLALGFSGSHFLNIIGVGAGTAIVTFTSTDGCTDYDTVTVNPNPGFITHGLTQFCVGDSSLVAASLPGGTWSCNNYGATQLDLVGAIAIYAVGVGGGGVSTITYSLPTGCYIPITDTVDAIPFPINPVSPDTNCQGTVITLSDFSAPGNWSASPVGALVFVDSTADPAIATVVDSGAATITYTNPAGCYVITTVYTLPGAPIAGNPIVCVGSVVTYTDVDTFMMGTWSNDNAAIGSVDNFGDFTGITTGTTNLSYTLPDGCTPTLVVSVNPIPDSILNNIPVCLFDSVTLADSTYPGGTWASSNNAIATINDSTGAVVGVGVGEVNITYTVNGCYIVDTEVVLHLPAPITGRLSICPYDSTNLFNDTLGGSWWSSNAAVGTISIFGVFTAAGAGTTIITYTSRYTGCTIDNIVTVNPTAAITVSQPPLICIGATDRITASSSVPGSTYAWSPAYALSTTVGTVVIATPTVTTVYTVTVTTGAGCVSDTAVTALVDSLLRYLKIVGRDSVCIGTCDTLKGSGENLTYFAWKPINALSCTICDTTIACPTDTTKYTAVAIDVFGCKDSVDFTVNVLPLPNLYMAENPTYVCRGVPTQLFAYGAYQYFWTPPYFLSCDTCDNPVATDTSNLVYKLVGYTKFGCKDSIDVRVSVLDTNFNKAGDDTIICLGGSAQLNAYSHSLQGNEDIPTYLWFPDSSLNNAIIPNPVATPNVTTVYSVVVTENACFKDTIPVIVVVDSLPRLQVIANPSQTLVFAGTSVQLTTTVLNSDTPSSYLWTPGISLNCSDCPNPIATPSVNTTYNVVVVTNRGCVSEDTVSIDIMCNSAQVFIPNTFSPNGDGHNDLFYVSAIGISSITRMSVYNRWGQQVFSAENILPNMPGSGWDGTYRGIVLEPDVFDYVIDVVCELGATYEYKGSISIVK